MSGFTDYCSPMFFTSQKVSQHSFSFEAYKLYLRYVAG
jgi:hypothetical protein